MTEQPEQLMFHGREIAMTSTEKAAMRHKLLAYTLSNPSRAAAVFTAWSWVRAHAVTSSVLAVVLVLGATGVSASMADPNDTLYNFRLQVNDRIESVVALNEDAQLDVEMRQIERQLNAEEGAVDEALADDQNDEQDEVEVTETPKLENLNRNDDKKSENEEREIANDELEVELRQMDRELQQEESATIELEI